MNPKVENLPGLRKPTEAEKAWIAEKWTPELKQGYTANGGKLTRYIGVFLICTGTVSLMRGETEFAGTLVVLILAALCIGFSYFSKKASRDHGARIKAVQTGDYLVTEGMSTKVYATLQANRPMARLNAELPDGSKLKSYYWVPYSCAKPWLEKNDVHLPILLIRFSCDPEILAIPVK